jgi:hypothetical protein
MLAYFIRLAFAAVAFLAIVSAASADQVLPNTQYYVPGFSGPFVTEQNGKTIQIANGTFSFSCTGGTYDGSGSRGPNSFYGAEIIVAKGSPGAFVRDAQIQTCQTPFGTAPFAS